jgi:hypothetical protein
MPQFACGALSPEPKPGKVSPFSGVLSDAGPTADDA